MNIIRSEIIKKARKDHYCDGANQLDRNIDVNDPAHKTAVDQYYVCKGIEKGSSYYKQVQVDGELQEYKSCLKCNEQIEKYKFYEND